MKTGSLLRLFPPPKYLMMSGVGFDISDRSLKYIELGEKNGSIIVNRFGSRIIPEGIIESGVIKNKEKLVNFLKFIKEELGVTYAIGSLPEERAFLSRIKLPLMDYKDIRNAIEAQLEEYIPLSVNDVIFDFELLGEVTSSRGEAGYLDINLVAFPKLVTETYGDAFKEAGFVPLAFEMETQSLIRAVVPRDERKSHLVVDFGKTRTTFVITNRGKIQFTSTIEVAGRDLDSAIMKSFEVDKFGAETIKKEKIFVNTKENEKFFTSLLPIISVVKDEIKKHINYWDSHLEKRGIKEGKIEEIILCGGDSNLFGLSDYLSAGLKISVNQGNPWINVTSFDKYVPDMELRESLMYASAIGLSLRTMVL